MKEAKKKTDKKKLLKRRHQNAKLKKICKWADRGKH